MKTGRQFWIAVVWLVALALLALAVQSVDWAAFREVASRLEGGRLTFLLALNTAILFLFGLRWWLVVHALGLELSVWEAFRYRLAAFGVSYFTPGPHFGGEPLQVYALHRHHGAPISAAVASVALDKLIELAVNFSFLGVGLLVVVASGVFGSQLGWGAAGAVVLALAAPVIYLLLLGRGRTPIGQLVAGLVERMPFLARLGRFAEHILLAEKQMGDFWHAHPRTVLGAVGVAGLTWVAMILEFGLLLAALGLAPGATGVIAAMTAARLALLTPLPGALGALEGSQALAFQALGYGVETGLAVSLFIRGRDVLFGLIGLALGRVFIR